METLVFFHAHPDDESISTAGAMCKAADAGHRVVLVVATLGEQGERPEGVVAAGESLAELRRAETFASAAVLGASRVEFLGYTDSGMAGWESNDAPTAFASAPVDEAAQRLAVILRSERADVLTCYDDHGGYGHPDHVAVHRVGMRASELAGTPRVFQATMNRDALLRQLQARPAGARQGAPSVEEATSWGTPEAELTTAVDVRPWLGRKRDAMRAHPSQIPPDSFFLAMPDEEFAAAFGTEWFIRVGSTAGITEDDLLG